ncbi:hypothetical protein V6Z11_A07G180100 [Gossypium hirsutum]
MQHTKMTCEYAIYHIIHSVQISQFMLDTKIRQSKYSMRGLSSAYRSYDRSTVDLGDTCNLIDHFKKMGSHAHVACSCGPHSPIWPWLCGPHGPIGQAYVSHTTSQTTTWLCHAPVSCTYNLACQSHARVLSHGLPHGRLHTRMVSTNLFFSLPHFSFFVFSGTHLVCYRCLLNIEITSTEINRTQFQVKFEKCDP